MGMVAELTKELFSGIRAGRQETLADRPYIKSTLGITPNYDALQAAPVSVGPLPPGVLGETRIGRDGSVGGIRISRDIPYMVARVAETYKKSKEWAKRVVYNMARHTTTHEDYHGLTAHLVRDEPMNDTSVKIMESVTTEGQAYVAERRGQKERTSYIRKTNPYKQAGMLARVAQEAPYEGPSGTGYAGFLRDASKEKFSRTMWRLTKSAAKAGMRKAMDYVSFRGRPAYAAA